MSTYGSFVKETSELIEGMVAGLLLALYLILQLIICTIAFVTFPIWLPFYAGYKIYESLSVR